MAIYRPPKPRWTLAIGVGFVCLLIGIGAGMALGQRDPAPAEVATGLRADLLAAAGSLEVAEIEYAESVTDGDVTKQAEYDGALGAIGSSRTMYGDVVPVLEALSPTRSREIAVLYEECSTAMRARQNSDQVTKCLTELSDLLKGEA